MFYLYGCQNTLEAVRSLSKSQSFSITYRFSRYAVIIDGNANQRTNTRDGLTVAVLSCEYWNMINARENKMNSESTDRFFANTRVLGAIDAEGRRRLIDAAEKLHFEHGQEVVREGEPGDALYIIVDGRAAVLVDDLGNSKEVAELSDGALFGEMAVITAQPRSATVVARGQLNVLRIPRQVVLDVLADYPRLKEIIAKLGVARTEQTLQKMMEE